MKGKYLLTALLLFVLLVSAQAQRRPLWQINGIISNETGDPLQYVQVISMQLQLASLSDDNGVYTITTTPGDTLIFSSMGYKKFFYQVPASAEKEWFAKDIVLESDTIQIREVVVMPWGTYEEFKEAVLAYIPHDPKAEAAEQNLALVQEQINQSVSPYPAPGVSYRHMMSRHIERLMTYNQLPVNNLLNPFAWAKFMEAVREGKMRLFTKEDE